MAKKIALESEAKSIGGSSLSVITNKMCTKARAEALGCKITGSYASNQLVAKDDLSKKTVSLGIATVTGSARRTSTGTEFNVMLSGYTRKSGVIVSIYVVYESITVGTLSHTFTGLSLADLTASRTDVNKFFPTESSYPTISSASVNSITSGYSLTLKW